MYMEFNVNSPVLFLLAGILILAVLAQSVFFLVRAWRRGIELGMEKERLKKRLSRRGVHHRAGGCHCHQRHYTCKGPRLAAAMAAVECGGFAVL